MSDSDIESWIEDQLMQVTVELAPVISVGRIELINELIRVGECDVALECICSTIIDSNQQVSNELYAKINGIGLRMRLDESIWLRVRHKET